MKSNHRHSNPQDTGTVGTVRTEPEATDVEVLAAESDGPAAEPESTVRVHPTFRDYLHAASRPKMIAFFLILLVAVLICGRLGAWQLDRAQERGAAAARAEAAATLSIPSKPIDEVLPQGSTMTATMVGEAVTASGTFDGANQLLVPGRVLDGREGSLVLTPLWIEGADGVQRVVPVVRGWVPEGELAGDPPSGSVTVAGWLQGSEGSQGQAVGQGEIDAISTAELINLWGGPIYPGYVIADLSGDASHGAGALAQVPRPAPESGSDLNLQNLLYAIQWWVFGGFAALIWFRLARDEARGDGPV